MRQVKHPSDAIVIRMLQQRGYVMSEAKARLKKDVYQLDAGQVQKVKNYVEHFGIHAKDKLIEEILDLRRERLISHLLNG